MQSLQRSVVLEATCRLCAQETPALAYSNGGLCCAVTSLEISQLALEGIAIGCVRHRQPKWDIMQTELFQRPIGAMKGLHKHTLSTTSKVRWMHIALARHKTQPSVCDQAPHESIANGCVKAHDTRP